MKGLNRRRWNDPEQLSYVLLHIAALPHFQVQAMLKPCGKEDHNSIVFQLKYASVDPNQDMVQFNMPLAPF